MPIFMSYSRDDEATVKILVRGFEKADREVWYDHDLEGGEIWWDTILRQIRASDLFLFAKSDHSLGSRACIAELEYAKALQRPILPVEVGHVTSERSNLLADVQHVVFRADDVTTAFEVLREADRAAKRAGPLPDPLPEEPPIPFAYLGEIREKIDGGRLDNDAQLDIVTQLRRSLVVETDTSARLDILGMLKTMLKRPWRTWAAGVEIRALLSAYEAFEDELAGQPRRSPTIPVEVAEPAVVEDWSEDLARTTFLGRINELVGEMQEGRAHAEALGFGGSAAPGTSDPEPPPFVGVGGGTPAGPTPAPDWAFPAGGEEPDGFAGVGRTPAGGFPGVGPTPAEGFPGVGHTPAGGFAGVGSTGAEEAPPAETPVTDAPETASAVADYRPLPTAVIYSRALAIAALVVSAAFAVLDVGVGRATTAAIFALPAAAGLVAIVSSGAALKRSLAGDVVKARRSSIIGIVWGLVAIAIAVGALAAILNAPPPI